VDLTDLPPGHHCSHVYLFGGLGQGRVQAVDSIAKLWPFCAFFVRRSSTMDSRHTHLTPLFTWFYLHIFRILAYMPVICLINVTMKSLSGRIPPSMSGKPRKNFCGFKLALCRFHLNPSMESEWFPIRLNQCSDVLDIWDGFWQWLVWQRFANLVQDPVTWNKWIIK
jgi:hypothetical protein